MFSVDRIAISFGSGNLFEEVSFVISPKERICLLGRNGTGKSTLLRLLLGEVEPDEGKITSLPGTTVAYLPQEVPAGIEGAVLDVVMTGVDETLEVWQQQEEARGVIARLDLPVDADFPSLSAGMQRRVLLARAMACGPDLLLLDEPTNHMDMFAIIGLENLLLRFEGSIIFVTHDRDFLSRLAVRILEIDRGRLFDWSCDYATFLERKEAALDAEASGRERFDRFLAEEETWVRQGLKARRKRNMGRVRRLKAMRTLRAERREAPELARLEIAQANRSGSLVFKVNDASFGYDGRSVVRNLTTRIHRLDRIGIVGPNGCGKTTLLRGLLGDLPPMTGSVRVGTGLEVVFFDQLREQLDLDRSVADNVGDGNDTFTVNGRVIHVMGYIKRFLFSRERAGSKVGSLSGGERNRLLLAKLFAMPSNVLVMDEPTNDLDIETLELLEAELAEYPGTLLLVSHDRAFLENVVTTTFVYQSDGVFKEYAGGYRDWDAQKPVHRESQAPRPVQVKTARPRKRNYRETEELKGLPARIETLEARQAELCQAMADPDYYKRAKEDLAADKADLDRIEADLAKAFERWEELEALGG
jgi:ATP-binding cassette subfamily F protein uup